MYVVFGHHPCTVSIPTVLHLASFTGFWHSATPTSVLIFNVFITLSNAFTKKKQGTLFLVV